MASDPDTAAFLLATQDMSLWSPSYIGSVVMDCELILYDGFEVIKRLNAGFVSAFVFSRC